MDHYFLLIHKEVPNIEEQCEILKYLNSLLPRKEEAFCSYSFPQLIPVLYRHATYFTVICADSYSEKCSWVQLPNTIISEHAFENCTFRSEEKDVSEIIHNLVDELPSYGTYHFDVIVDYSVLSKSISCDLDFAAALHRLHIWHNACISIVFKDESQVRISTLLEWCRTTGAKFLFKSQRAQNSPLIWRGSIHLGLEECANFMKLKGFELKMDNEDDIQDVYLQKLLGLPQKSSSAKDFIMLASNLEVLAEYNMASIPLYMFAPVVWKLGLTHSEETNAESFDFLKSVNSRPGVALILRLRYSFSTKKFPRTYLYTTEKWKKSVLSGNVNCPESQLTVSQEYLTLVLTSSQKNDSLSASVYLLNHPQHLKCDFYHCALETCLTKKPSKAIKAACGKILKDVPHLEYSTVYNCITFLKNAQKKILKNLLVKNKLNSPKLETCINEEELKQEFYRISDIVFSKLKEYHQPSLFLQGQEDCLSFIEEIDPSDWPERVYFLRQQILSDKKKGYCSSDTLAGLPAPLPQNNVIYITAKEIGDFFTQSGEGTFHTVNMPELLRVKNKYCYEKNAVEQVIVTDWPEACYVKYHDIYYNCDTDCELEEARSNKVKDSYVQQQTSSICNNQQHNPNYMIVPIQSKNGHPQPVTPNSKARNKKKAVAHLHFGHKKPLKQIYTDNSFKKQRDMPVLEKEEPLPNHTSKKHVLGHFSNNNLPLRRSPRKHVSHSFKISQTQKRNKPPTLRKEISKNGELSEKHRLKLREAVAFALEKYNVTLNHPSFKPCGRKLFAICKAFVKDVIGKGSTSSQMKRIAEAHAKQVVEFELQKCT